MARKFEPRPVFAFSNPNKAVVVDQFDKLRAEWEAWHEHARKLPDGPDSPDFDPQKTAESLKDGRENLEKHERLREKTLVFMGNNFVGYGYLFENWPSHPHEDVTARLVSRVPGWLKRLDTLADSIEYARVPDAYWTEKGKQLVDKLVGEGPEKAAEIAASWLKNPFGD